MSKQEERVVWWSVPLVAAAFGCGPEGPTSLEAGVDETSGDDGGSGGGGSTGGGGGTGGGGDPGGGGSSDGVAPQLISARTDETGLYLLLRFSEPMAPPAGVDPSDFRISRAMTISFQYSYYNNEVFSYSEYYDLVFTSPYYTYPYSPFVIASVTAGGLATDLVLEFDEPLSTYACDVLHEVQANIEETEQYDPTFEGRLELFPHYSPGEIPVRSAQGESLAAIGPEWVELDGLYMYVEEFGFPNLSPQIPIDCIVEG